MMKEMIASLATCSSARGGLPRTSPRSSTSPSMRTTSTTSAEQKSGRLAKTVPSWSRRSERSIATPRKLLAAKKQPATLMSPGAVEECRATQLRPARGSKQGPAARRKVVMTQSLDSTSVARCNPDDIVRRGQEAWSRLQSGRSWEDWLSVGEAIQVGRHRAMFEADTNQPRGSRYDCIFGDWLRETGFDTLDKG